MVPEPDHDFGPDRYGESFADIYDEWYDDVSDAEATARFVHRFGEGQRVLELGVGTGRLSTPIAERGHHVVGVDASLAMLERFRHAKHAAAVGADMQHLPFGRGGFDTVLVATNTLFNLHTEAAQAACLTESRRVLRLGGRLIVEAMVPAPPDPALDRLLTTKSITTDQVVLTATIRDSDAQVITGQHIQISEQGIRLRPWKIRYTTPAQLDLLAEAAGLRLGDRFENWDESPWSGTSPSAISVYVAV